MQKLSSEWPICELVNTQNVYIKKMRNCDYAQFYENSYRVNTQKYIYKKKFLLVCVIWTWIGYTSGLNVCMRLWMLFGMVDICIRDMKYAKEQKPITLEKEKNETSQEKTKETKFTKWAKIFLAKIQRTCVLNHV